MSERPVPAQQAAVSQSDDVGAPEQAVERPAEQAEGPRQDSEGVTAEIATGLDFTPRQFQIDVQEWEKALAPYTPFRTPDLIAPVLGVREPDVGEQTLRMSPISLGATEAGRQEAAALADAEEARVAAEEQRVAEEQAAAEQPAAQASEAPPFIQAAPQQPAVAGPVTPELPQIIEGVVTGQGAPQHPYGTRQPDQGQPFPDAASFGQPAEEQDKAKPAGRQGASHRKKERGFRQWLAVAMGKQRGTFSLSGKAGQPDAAEDESVTNSTSNAMRATQVSSFFTSAKQARPQDGAAPARPSWAQEPAEPAFDPSEAQPFTSQPGQDAVHPLPGPSPFEPGQRAAWQNVGQAVAAQGSAWPPAGNGVAGRPVPDRSTPTPDPGHAPSPNGTRDAASQPTTAEDSAGTVQQDAGWTTAHQGTLPQTAEQVAPTHAGDDAAPQAVEQPVASRQSPAPGLGENGQPWLGGRVAAVRPWLTEPAPLPLPPLSERRGGGAGRLPIRQPSAQRQASRQAAKVQAEQGDVSLFNEPVEQPQPTQEPQQPTPPAQPMPIRQPSAQRQAARLQATRGNGPLPNEPTEQADPHQPTPPAQPVPIRQPSAQRQASRQAAKARAEQAPQEPQQARQVAPPAQLPPTVRHVQPVPVIQLGESALFDMDAKPPLVLKADDNAAPLPVRQRMTVPLTLPPAAKKKKEEPELKSELPPLEEGPARPWHPWRAGGVRIPFKQSLADSPTALGGGGEQAPEEKRQLEKPKGKATPPGRLVRPPRAGDGRSRPWHPRQGELDITRQPDKPTDSTADVPGPPRPEPEQAAVSLFSEPVEQVTPEQEPDVPLFGEPVEQAPAEQSADPADTPADDVLTEPDDPLADELDELAEESGARAENVVSGPGKAQGVQSGTMLEVVALGLPVAGFLPLWHDDGRATYWRVESPRQLLDRLGQGIVSRTEIDTQRFREVAAVDMVSGTMLLMDRFRNAEGGVAGESVKLHQATEEQARAAATAEARAELYAWLGETVRAASDRGEFIAVETGGWEVPLRPCVLIMVRPGPDGQSFSVVEASPVPEGAPIWVDRQPVATKGQVLASPVTDVALRAAGPLTGFAVDAWGMHPFQLGLSFGPNPTLAADRTG
ncbi:hypothetical protein [Actinokineospora pegani]|uniref:hypothetical protein n=1 Tax=Actinokineospora pegani TaxID=2654637 RepID=UPI0012E9FF65|nr:hypothetical protein [Actinokineospora pegani]